jgi:hypothetical protein
MDHADMMIDEFEDLAFTYGSDPAVWPEGVRAKAVAFASVSPVAIAVLEQMRDLEEVLISARPVDPVPSVEMMTRILADAAMVRPSPAPSAQSTAPTSVLAFSRILAIFSPAAACAASAVLGLWLGYAGPVDFTGIAADSLGVEVTMEFALLDEIGDSPIAGVVDVLEASK